MPAFATIVACRDCGKSLRGTTRIHGGYEVRKHKRPDGTPCAGHQALDHKKEVH